MNIESITYLKKQLETELEEEIKKHKQEQKRTCDYTSHNFSLKKKSIGELKAICLMTGKTAGEVFEEAMSLYKTELELKFNREIEPVDHATKLPNRGNKGKSGRRASPGKKVKALLKAIDNLLDARREQSAAQFDVT